MTFRIVKGVALGGASHVHGEYVYEIHFQGCLKRCENCPHKDVWPVLGGTKLDSEAFKKMIASDTLVRGICLMGGEPFLQPSAAIDLSAFAKKRGLTVYAKSGYSFEEICEWEDNRRQLLRLIDYLSVGCGGEEKLLDVKKSIEKGEAVVHDAG